MKKSLELACVVLALGCAGAPSAGTTGSGSTPKVIPPSIVGSTTPVLESSGGRRSGAAGPVDIAVMIDTNGSPDMKTFKVTGRGVGTNADGYARWIESTQFKPAQLNGAPVAALFTLHIEPPASRGRGRP